MDWRRGWDSRPERREPRRAGNRAAPPTSNEVRAGGEGGIRTRHDPLDSVSYRFYVTRVAVDASGAVAPCTGSHRRLSSALFSHADAHQPMAPGDIVRHADYPQWGGGYVIRAKKTSSDVFFQWGGKRRIDAGEPLEPSRASGVEAEFFSLCAGLSARSWSRGHHSVYAIELDRAVWKNRAFRERNPGGATGGCLYIGVTGLTPEERFERHRLGTQSGASSAPMASGCGSTWWRGSRACRTGLRPAWNRNSPHSYGHRGSRCGRTDTPRSVPMSDEVKNYITPGGYRRLQEELARLWKVERPPIVTTVAWAAGNGDRSENGDYIYGKRKLREIDRRMRYLSKSLDRAVVVDNAGKTHERVHFGATVTILYETGDEREVTIVGVDELDSGDARVSWRSPLARALLTAKVGDTVTLRAPRGPERLEIIAVRYDDLR
ncbi:MAG: transcription elongation factor GreB [Luteitalea sp.]|nr:transcription elongation factor GreB [Luteitalea sp.]